MSFLESEADSLEELVEVAKMMSEKRAQSCAVETNTCEAMHEETVTETPLRQRTSCFKIKHIFCSQVWVIPPPPLHKYHHPPLVSPSPSLPSLPTRTQKGGRFFLVQKCFKAWEPLLSCGPLCTLDKVKGRVLSLTLPLVAPGVGHRCPLHAGHSAMSRH